MVVVAIAIAAGVAGAKILFSLDHFYSNTHSDPDPDSDTSINRWIKSGR